MNTMSAHTTACSPANARPSALLRHPLVQEACQVATPPGAIRRHRSSTPWSNDPDRLVMVSCLVSFLVLPFVL